MFNPKEPEAVETFVVSGYTNDSVDLTWTIKDTCKNDSCVWDSYNITYTPDDRSTPVVAGKVDTSSTISSLTPGQTYDMEITAISATEISAPTKVTQTLSKFSLHATIPTTLHYGCKASSHVSQVLSQPYLYNYSHSPYWLIRNYIAFSRYYLNILYLCL